MTSPSWARLKMSSSETLLAAAARELLGLQAVGALAGELRAPCARSRPRGRTRPPRERRRSRGPRRASPGVALLDFVAEVVVHRADATPVGAARRARRRPRACRAGSSTVTTGPRPGIELGLDDEARASVFGLALSSSTSAITQDRLEQVVEALLGLGRDVDELGVAAPLGRLQAELGHLGADALGLRALLVDLVDRDDDRHLGGLRVVDGLLRSGASRRRRRRPRCTTMSVTFAPRARMAVNASWPGVSRKVTSLSP